MTIWQEKIVQADYKGVEVFEISNKDLVAQPQP